MPLDRDQLIKLLNLTRSEYDAEALNAIRRANALLRKHQATWADLLALPQESSKARQPKPTQARQQRPRGSDAFKAKHGYRATNSTTQVQFSLIGWLPPSLTILFFPSVVYVWLYERVVPTRRRRLKPVAMLVPIFGGATAALIWVFLLLAAAQLMD
jgi:hypothetical protein